MRIDRWGLLGLAALTLLMLITGTAEAKRNVVLFVTDDQSPDTGCYGNPHIKTPNIDALAGEGVRLDYAFCTTASCSASRSVILSGMFNHANAQYGHQHSYHHFRSFDRVKSLPVRLSGAGYHTIRIGKYHVAEEVYKFDTVLKGNSRNPVEMANNCRETLADKDKPFFLYFCTSDPHRGGGTVKSDQYKPNAFGNKGADGYPGVKEVTYQRDQVQVPPFLPDTPTCRAELAQYAQSVSRIDQGLGRLVQVLKDAGVYDNTVIIYTADHGMAFPGGKTTLYEGGMRVPMIVRSPDIEKPGGVCNAMVSLVDVTPTILDVAGALPAKPAPKELHGRSFYRVLNQQNPQGFDEVRASHTFHEITMYYPMRVIRTRKYKLIWNLAHGLPYPFASDLWAAPTWQDIYKQGMDAYYGKRTVRAYIFRPKFELYDMQADPDETVNLAESKDHAQVFQELQAKIKDFQKKTQDPWLLKWDYE